MAQKLCSKDVQAGVAAVARLNHPVPLRARDSSDISRHKQVDATIRFHGENMEAGRGLSRKIEKHLKVLDVLSLQNGAKRVGAYGND
jgi:hypothetical protein